MSVLDTYRNLRPKDTPFHLPPSALPLNGKIVLILENVPAGKTPYLVMRDTRRDLIWKSDMIETANGWEIAVMMPSEPTIIHYQFQYHEDETIILERRQVEGHNTPVYGKWEERPFQISVYHPDAMPAKWTRGMIIYQIFPDSFNKSGEGIFKRQYGVYGSEVTYNAWNDDPQNPPRGADFYGGNLKGITEKIPYLKNLGVQCIYLTPIFHSPTNHRYDAVDYLEIDPMLGTEQEFVQMVETAHQHDMKIVLDLVYNHCSSDSRYFDLPGRYGGGASQSQASPYFRWFDFQAWPHKFRGWDGWTHMPEFVECPEVEDFFLGEKGVTAYWLARGVDGYRTDVTFDNTEEFWKRFRKRINAIKPDAYLVSEEWRNASHYLLGDMFSATMNYRFTWAVWGFFAHEQLTPSQMDDRLAVLRRDTPPPALQSQMNILGSHDLPRPLHACAEDKQKFMQMVAFQLAYPGAPMIYYGDEAGITSLDHAESGRKAFPWGKEDKDIGQFYQHALAARASSKALRYGDFYCRYLDDANRIYIFARQYKDEVVTAAFHGGTTPTPITLPLILHYDDAAVFEDLLGQYADVPILNNTLTVTLQPQTMAWFRVKGT